MTIYFYKVRGEKYGAFSNFSQHPFELDGVVWSTSEHYFQAQKFTGTAHVEEVRTAPTAMQAAKMGRERHRPLRRDWETVKDDVMRRAVLCKFETHADIQALLLETGSEDIVEDSPTDYYWGCGAKKTGKNMLGKILMETRDILRKQVTTQNV